ncbi:hypothetical protein QZH41_017315 [Actinostola sp. cb2023]|nr:hypothetical protein QZH41_017315 [Actinostola sp. cb2023]
MPRRSPRIASRRNDQVMDVFVFEATKSKTAKNGDMKLSQTSVVLRGFSIEKALSKLKESLKTTDTTTLVFVPSKGLFWLRKGNKQIVSLNTDDDLKCCIENYKDAKGNVKTIRIACASLDTTFKAHAGASTSTSRKRVLEFSDSNDLGLSKLKADENDLWNTVHCSLVRDLEKKGIISRYGVKHLKLWTDEIIKGTSTGIGDEPIWQNFIDQVGVPPKSPRLSQTEKTSASVTTDDLLKAIFLQNQQRIEMESKRAETFQHSIMALMAVNSPVLQQQVNL